jgi:hypothetical protein
MNVDLRKSWFKGTQTQQWGQILKHELFQDSLRGEDDLIDFEWLTDGANEAQVYKDTREKVYSIFLERSSVLYAADATVIWLKEVAGFLLDAIEAGKIDRLEFIGKIASVVENPFKLDRYLSLKIADFTDDMTTIDPNELLGAGPPQNNQVAAGGQANAAQAARNDAMIQQMV